MVFSRLVRERGYEIAGIGEILIGGIVNAEEQHAVYISGDRSKSMMYMSLALMSFSHTIAVTTEDNLKLLSSE